MSKIIRISKQQETFLSENKGKLFEYYVQVSKPSYDSKILGNIQIWVYGNDRQSFTPHCHVMLADKSIEFEVSIIDWSIINVKKPQNKPCGWSSFRKIAKPFFIWLKSEGVNGLMNKMNIYFDWDGANPNNILRDFVEKKNLNVNDNDLLEYINKFN